MNSKIHYLPVQKIISDYKAVDDIEYTEDDVISVESSWDKEEEYRVDRHNRPMLSIRTLELEYINSGYTFRRPIIVGFDENNELCVMNGHSRVFAVRNLLNKHMITAENSLIPVHHPDYNDTEEVICGDYFISYRNSFYAFCFIEFEVTDRNNLSKNEISDLIMGDEETEGIFEELGSFKLNNSTWASIETSMYNSELLSGNIFCSLDLNAMNTESDLLTSYYNLLIDKTYEYYHQHGIGVHIKKVSAQDFLDDIRM